MAEVETQPVGRDQRAFLRDVLAQTLPERLMQKMGHRVIGAQSATAGAIDPQLDGVSYFQRSVRDGSEMEVKIAPPF